MQFNFTNTPEGSNFNKGQSQEKDSVQGKSLPHAFTKSGEPNIPNPEHPSHTLREPELLAALNKVSGVRDYCQKGDLGKDYRNFQALYAYFQNSEEYVPAIAFSLFLLGAKIFSSLYLDAETEELLQWALGLKKKADKKAETESIELYSLLAKLRIRKGEKEMALIAIEEVKPLVQQQQGQEYGELLIDNLVGQCYMIECDEVKVELKRNAGIKNDYIVEKLKILESKRDQLLKDLDEHKTQNSLLKVEAYLTKAEILLRNENNFQSLSEGDFLEQAFQFMGEKLPEGDPKCQILKVYYERNMGMACYLKGEDGSQHYERCFELLKGALPKGNSLRKKFEGEISSYQKKSSLSKKKISVEEMDFDKIEDSSKNSSQKKSVNESKMNRADDKSEDSDGFEKIEDPTAQK